ncbi:MAG: VOC family protein [candidate division Zixibacteria bacterium]|nr:VOC family protein [candidate division Zixibacteria bacterium]
MQKITPFLWFDKEAREAAKFYTSIFKGSKIKGTDTFSDTPSGAVDVVAIELLGQEFILMSAGPQFKFNEAVSFVVNCTSQDEVDYYWEKLTSGGGQESMCGWLKDKFGLSWQVVPAILNKLLQDKDPKKSGRAMQAMLQMKKIDIEKLKKASEAK